MRKLWLALFAMIPLLVGGVGTANAQMHGAGGRHGVDGGHFHDGRLSHDARFQHFHTNSRMFGVTPAFWWGAPYYQDYYPVSFYDGSSAWPIYGEPGPMTYTQPDRGPVTRSGAGQSSRSRYWNYCSEPAGYYPQVQNCANGWLKVVPVVVDDHAPAIALRSKESNNAEQFAKANGCRAPVVKMNFAIFGVDNFETFSVACESERLMSVRCDSGQCRAT